MSNKNKGNQSEKDTQPNLDIKETELTTFKNELDNRKKTLDQREKEINEKKTDNIAKEVELDALTIEAESNFPKLFAEKFAEATLSINDAQSKISNEWQSINKEKGSLLTRENAVKKAEIEKDSSYAEQEKSFNDKLFNKTQEQQALLAKEKEDSLSKIQEEISKRRQKTDDELTRDMEAKWKEHESRIQADKDTLQKQKEDNNNRCIELEEKKLNLDFQEKKNVTRKKNLDERERDIDTEVMKKTSIRKSSFEVEKQQYEQEIARLQESVTLSITIRSQYDELERKLGGEAPEKVLQQLTDYEQSITALKEDLANRPTQEIQEALERLKTDKNVIEKQRNEYKEELNVMKITQNDIDEVTHERDDLAGDKKRLLSVLKNSDAHNNILEEQLKRLQSTYERTADREQRIKDIESPYLRQSIQIRKNDVDEQEWLDHIYNSCKDYGLTFPKRILNAFHTALKTSEWSPLTVLAGVSGTGKSELPRLYAHFGGINFLSLAVQPNWDSQESMLGFFNSIDNQFDAQPVLRLLAQSQKEKTDDYEYGLKDTVNLVLLDEMNLAYVELYFAEFLSKLELRRGVSSIADIPSLEVKLGAGIEPYQLTLGRNVLWTGTMNQDETTKSLSDKVIDRGILINFPRPTKLHSRKKLQKLPAQGKLLDKDNWYKWWCKEVKFEDNQIGPYKLFIETMNESLSKVGRAMGHRVWQSIEYYMANHPDVLQAQKNTDEDELKKAMKIAFEDQLVQKVMPKLRGIETRGRSKTECLDKIRAQLKDDEYAIVDDFDLACSDLGYGQFMWNSANYIQQEDDLVQVEQNEERIEDADDGIDEMITILRLVASQKNKQLNDLTIIEIKKELDLNEADADMIKDYIDKENIDESSSSS